VSFEDKIKHIRGQGMPYKYPNIELKRCFDAKNFRESNRQITRLASTRAGSMRSHVQTTIPQKYRKASETTTQGRKHTANVGGFGVDSTLEESESQ